MMPYDDPMMMAPQDAGLSDSPAISPTLLMQFLLTQQQPQPSRPKPPPRPTIDDLKEKYDRIKNNFTLRNRNIEDWRRFTRVEDEYRDTNTNGQFTADPKDDAPITVTQPAIIVRRRVQKTGNLNLNPKMTPGGKTAEDEANAVIVNKFMQTARACWDDDYRNGGGSSSRQQAEAQYADEDGHLYTWIRPVESRPSMPFAVRLMEPTRCIPHFGIKDGVPSLLCFFEEQHTTLRELRAEWGTIRTKKTDQNEDDPIKVINYCDHFYTAVWSPDIEGELVRKPALHGYGTIPVVASFCGGKPSEAAERGPHNAGLREANRGRSVIADHVGVLARLAEMMAALKRALFKAVDPPVHAINGDEDSGIQVPRNPGEVSQTGKGSEIRFLVDSPQVAAIAQQIMTMDMDSLRLDNLLANPDLARASGFDRVVASLEAEETMADLVACIEDHESRVFQTMLTMGYNLRLEPEMQQALYFDEEGTKGGSYERFDFSILPPYPHVTCKLETLSNINRIQLLGQAGQVLPTGLASARTLREWAGIDDSDGEQSRIQEEMARMNPAFVELTSPVDQLIGLRDRMRQAEQRGNHLEAEALRIMYAKQVEQILTVLQQPASPPQPPGTQPGTNPMQQAGPMGPASSLPPGVGVPGGIPPELAMMGMGDMQTATTMAGGIPPNPGGF